MNTSENSKMKPHKWAKEISHFVNGGEVEARLHNGTQWFKTYHLYEFDADLEFRIKPKKKTIKVAVFVNRNGGVPFICHSDIVDINPGHYKQLSDIVEIEYEDK